jgi:hypothetical protein
MQRERDAHIKLDLGNLGPLVRVVREWVAEFNRPGLGSEALEELIVDARLDKDTRAGAAALPVVPADDVLDEQEKAAPNRLMKYVLDAVGGPVNSLVEVRIVEYDVRGLSTQLERDVLQIRLCRPLHDLAPDKCGPRERYLINTHMFRDSLTNSVAITINDIYDTRWEASLIDE